jgi:hypothetical protein
MSLEPESDLDFVFQCSNSCLKDNLSSRTTKEYSHLSNNSSYVMSLYDIIDIVCFFKNDNAYLQLIRGDVVRHRFTILLKMSSNAVNTSIFIQSHKM